jgi:chromosome segregation ATPase
MLRIKEELQEIKSEIVQIEQGLGSLEVWRDKVREQFGLEDLRKRLLAIPAEIEKKQLELKDIRAQIPDAEEALKRIEAEQLFEITNETNGAEKPKPKFPNAESRKAELTRRLSVDPAHAAAKDQLITVQGREQTCQIEIDRLQNEFRVQRNLKDLAVAEMGLLGA